MVINCMLNGNALIIYVIVGLIKKISLYDLWVIFQNHNAKGVDTSKSAKKADLASLKSDIDKLDTDKLNIIPGNWSKLSNVVENTTVKNCIVIHINNSRK